MIFFEFFIIILFLTIVIIAFKNDFCSLISLSNDNFSNDNFSNDNFSNANRENISDYKKIYPYGPQNYYYNYGWYPYRGLWPYYNPWWYYPYPYPLPIGN